MSLFPEHDDVFSGVDNVNFFLAHLFTDELLLLSVTHKLFNITLCDGRGNEPLFAGILLGILEKLNDSP